MKTLLYKQLRLVCHPMTPVFCLFGFMVIIPNYPYTVIFFYVMLGLFFTFLNMREQKDLYYTALLPVPKRDAVKAGCLFTALIELLSLAVLVPCALLAVRLQPGKDNLVGMATTLAMIVFEALPHVPGLMWLDDMDAATQVRLLPYFVAAVLLYGIGTVLTFRRAAAQYEKVDM